jgi:hypothetical protein
MEVLFYIVFIAIRTFAREPALLVLCIAPGKSRRMVDGFSDY